MSIVLDLDPETEQWLGKHARASGRTVSEVAMGVLQRASQPFVVKPFDLGPLAERFQGMSPSEINDELEIEDYLESLERARR